MDYLIYNNQIKQQQQKPQPQGFEKNVQITEDDFSFGDLALIKSISLNYGIESDQITEIKKLTDSWAPYKTVASLLLWKSVEEKIFYE